MDQTQKLSIGKRAEKSWQDTSISAKFLVWLLPVLFTIYGTWFTFKDLPAKVYAQDTKIEENTDATKENAHKHDLAEQDREHMTTALLEITSVLKDIRSDQRQELKNMRDWRNHH